MADDHKIVLEGLKRLLEPEFDLVGLVEDGRSLVSLAEKLHPDVIVLDIDGKIAPTSGIALLRQYA